MWFFIVALGGMGLLVVLIGATAVRRRKPRAERRATVRVPCRFRGHGAGFSPDQEFEGNLSVGGAMVVMRYPAFTSTLALDALDPAGAPPLLLAGTVLSVDEVEGDAFGYAHHVRFDPNFRTPALDALVQRCGG